MSIVARISRSRRAVAALVIAFALAAIVLTVVGGDSDSSPEKRATNDALADALALGSREAEAELERRSQALEDAGEKAGRKTGTSEVEAIDRRSDAIDDLSWRAFDEQFRKTPFDKAIDELPLRKPPLNVMQWVTDAPPDKLRSKSDRERFYGMSKRARRATVRAFYRGAPHKLYARVDYARFFAMSERAREAAVRAFYRDAQPLFKKAGIDDFTLVVTPWTETVKDLPALAVGHDGRARLTPLGRGEGGGS